MPTYEPGDIQRYAQAIRLNDIPRKGRKIEGWARESLKSALIRSIVDITWQKEANSSVNPTVRFRLEPTRLLCDLFTMTEDAYPAALWRSHQFNGVTFRRNVEEALDRALNDWEQSKLNTAYIATNDYTQVMPAQQASDVKPRRL